MSDDKVYDYTIEQLLKRVKELEDAIHRALKLSDDMLYGRSQKVLREVIGPQTDGGDHGP